MRHIPGFGRPIVALDERIPPLLRLSESLGLDKGKHVETAKAVESILQAKRKRMNMNITGLAAALSADQGLKPREYQAYVCLAFGAGILPCYVDAAEHDEGAFFPMRCNRINYSGCPPRSWE